MRIVFASEWIKGGATFLRGLLFTVHLPYKDHMLELLLPLDAFIIETNSTEALAQHSIFILKFKLNTPVMCQMRKIN